MSVAERIPGTGDWLLARVDARVELKLRKELRRLQRDLDAIFVGLWVAATRSDVLLEFAGEIAIAPSRCPSVSSTAPSFETLLCADGAEHDAIVHRPRLGRRMPQIVLAAVETGVAAAPVLFDVVEDSGERIEELLVGAAGAHPRCE